MSPDHILVTHEAMKTTFSLRLCGSDPQLLHGLASECCQIINHLEQKLSRYFEGGEVHRINHLQAGETLNLSQECYQCLREALDLAVMTGGLFDPSLGRLIDQQKATGIPKDSPQKHPGKLILHPDRAAITCEQPGRLIDLGGIGKGFTLDHLANFLNDWDLEGFLLSSGASTHLAKGSHAWPIELSGDHSQLTISLANAALSASGKAIQGSHIVNPRSHDPDFAECHLPARIWTQSPRAAAADAWSTAAMLMHPSEIQEAITSSIKLDQTWLEHQGSILPVADILR